MTSLKSLDLTVFRHRLIADGYTRNTVHAYVGAVRQFLRYLDKRGVTLDTVDSSHVSTYLQRRGARYQAAHHRAPPSENRWRSQNHGGIPNFLRTVLGDWPRLPEPKNPREASDRQTLDEYRQRLERTTDYAKGTVEGFVYEAERFQVWSRKNNFTTDGLQIQDIDSYTMFRSRTIRRTTCKTLTKRVSHFLRFLYQTGRLRENLGPRIISPTVYQYEAIPSILEPKEIDTVLRETKRDRSTKGRRDYAILQLLATYGMRAGEVTRLRLQDIDWRAETLTVTHTKTRSLTILPLMPQVAAAVIAYLRHGRPHVPCRALFLRVKAPFRGLKEGHGIQTPVLERLKAAGIRPLGKRGPHIFRHARAVSLLRARVPTKAISDILGHRSPRSTDQYIKLQTEDLRAIALPVPVGGEVSHEHRV
jgi:site-specific recombinase XerD